MAPLMAMALSLKHMWLRWLPWRFLIQHAARASGFIDPISILARLHRFAQPSEVAEPIELLRAGVVLHARGLINTRAIQTNLDWVWPYWVERQFNPHDVSFIPRAFSITHVNLTHRNWTAVGLPGCDAFPIVDPAGLVTPHFDGWSIDVWALHQGGLLIPSRTDSRRQTLSVENGISLTTESHGEVMVTTRVEVVYEEGLARCRIRASTPDAGVQLIVALRPTNPEGVSFIHSLSQSQAELNHGARWIVNGRETVDLAPRPRRLLVSNYTQGDVFTQLCGTAEQPPSTTERGETQHCDVGMITAAAVFEAGEQATINIELPGTARESSESVGGEMNLWQRALAGRCHLKVPNELYTRLFDQASSTLILLSPGDVFPGPFTYKRFWFRDAAFMLDGLLALNLTDRVRLAIDNFRTRQRDNGYFRSQEGEWDSNGQVLWILERSVAAGIMTLSTEWLRRIEHASDWIVQRLLSAQLDARHAGLMPAGFSAEHLGPNDFYYWDNFWSIAGLHSAARMHHDCGHTALARHWDRCATQLRASLERSVMQSRTAGSTFAASPYRRMDSGAIGSIVGSYPLRLFSPHHARTIATVEWILEHCLVEGAFFQDMIHAGLNAYLTMHLAQVLLRAGDRRFESLVERVAGLASSTGQWPEAIHPHTLGGCMGDGQHGWAAAEWVLMMRAMLVREEDGVLLFGSGIPPSWLESPTTISIGPTLTRYGEVYASFTVERASIEITVEAHWSAVVPECRAHIPGLPQALIKAGETITLRRPEAVAT